MVSIFNRWAYQPLPGNNSRTVVFQQRHERRRGRRIIIITIVSVLAAFILLWFTISKFLARPYNPLIDYQDLGSPSIIYEGYVPPPSSPSQHAVVSSLYSDSFAIGVAVLGHSVRAANVSARLMLPYLEGVSLRALCIAKSVGWEPVAVPRISPPHNGKGVYWRFRDQYSKLNIWSFDRMGITNLVYLDADTLVLRNFDELFQSPYNFAAVQDVWTDNRGFGVKFNAGVLVLRPWTPVFEDMKQKIEIAKFPPSMAEQAFLNLFFAGKGLRLPYVYNANLAIKKRSPALWEALKPEMRIVHYTLVKPFSDDLSHADTILPLDEMDKVLNEAAAREGGSFAEEIEWWHDAYQAMLYDKGHEIASCFQH